MYKLKTFEPTIKYYDLTMVLDNFDKVQQYPLPSEFCFEYFSGNIDDWLNIHISTGEFASKTDAINTFNIFYTKLLDKLDKRLIFIKNINGEKIATATLSPNDEDASIGVIDWFAVSKSAQGKKLSKPLLSKIVDMAKNFELNKIILHTQTNSWLAAKVYLDFGFEPLITDEIEGWRILKTITNHPKLAEFTALPLSEIYSPLMLNIKNELAKLHTDFDFNVWYINGRNDIYVNEKGDFFEYIFFDNGKRIERK